MDWNSKKDLHVPSVNFSEKQYYLPQGYVSDMYIQSQQAPLPAQNASNCLSRIQKEYQFPKSSTVKPLIPNKSYGPLNVLPSLTITSDVPINNTSSTVCSENTNPQNSDLVGIMKEPIVYHPVTTMSHLSAFNSSPVGLQSQASSSNVQMLCVPSHQFRVQTSSDDNRQQTNLSAMVSSSAMPDNQHRASLKKMCLVWVPHQNYKPPVAQQIPMQSTPVKVIHVNLDSQQSARIPNTPSQNQSMQLQPMPPCVSTLTTHMQQNKKFSQRAAVLPQTLNMQLHSHRDANPIDAVSQGQSQKYIIQPPVQQPYVSKEINLKQHNLDPPDFLCKSTLQPVHWQPPPKTQPLKVQNPLLVDKPKIFQSISSNLNASQPDSTIAHMSPCELSKHAETVVPFNRRFVSETPTLAEVGILQYMCKNGPESLNNGLAPGEKFPMTLNSLPQQGSNSLGSIDLSSRGSVSDQPVNFTASLKDAQILTEDDMVREVQILLQAKQDFINLVKDFKEKRKLYKSLKCNNGSSSDVKCTRAGNTLNGIKEEQIVPKIPDGVRNLPGLPLQHFNVIEEQQSLDRHKKEKANICTDSPGSNQTNNQSTMTYQKVAKDLELLIDIPDENQNYMFNKAGSELKEITAGNRNYSKVSEANETVQTLPQNQALVSPSSKKARSPLLTELITEAINSYSNLTETQPCLPNSVKEPTDAVHLNGNNSFSNFSNLPHCNSHASTSHIASTVTDECLKEGALTNLLTDGESSQLNSLTEVLKSCIGMWKLPISFTNIESNPLLNTNTGHKQALSTSGFCDPTGLHQKNVQQPLSKTETSIIKNDTSHCTGAVSSSSMVKASEPQVAIVNPLVPCKSNNTIAAEAHESRNIESYPVNLEGNSSRVLGNVSTKGMSSADKNRLLSNLRRIFRETVSDPPLSAVDHCEIVAVSESSSSGNIIETESVQSLQTEKEIKCPDVPDPPKPPHVLRYVYENHEPFKSQPNRTCEESSLSEGELNVIGPSVFSVGDAGDEQLRISSICTFVEGSALYDSQIAQMFDRGISTACKISQEESVGLITPTLLEDNVPSKTHSLDKAPQQLTNQLLSNTFSAESDDPHSFGSSKVVLKIAEHNPDLAKTFPESCKKESEPVEKNNLVKHPCVRSEMENSHFMKNDRKECLSLTPIEICTPNLETQQHSDQDIHDQKNCVIPANFLEDNMNILSAQCLNDQFTTEQFQSMLMCESNVEMQTPSDQDIHSEKDNGFIPVDYLEDDTLDILSAECLNDQLSELQKQFPYGFERLESMCSSKNSLLVDQKTFVDKVRVDEEVQLSSKCVSSSDIYSPLKDNSTNRVTEYYVAENKPMMSKQSNENSESELNNLNDGCEPSQLKDLQLDDCNMSSIDVCDSDKDDFVKKIKITVLDSQQMITFFPEMTTQCGTNVCTDCSQQNVQSEENKDNPSKLNSENDREILQTDAEKNDSTSNENLYCCLYRWLSSSYGLAPKCSCVPASKMEDATNALKCKESDIKRDNSASGNCEIIDLSTESSDEDGNLTIEDQRQNCFVTSTDVKQIKANRKRSPLKSKKSPIKVKDLCAEQKLDPPLYAAQSEIELLSVQEKDHVAQLAFTNISGNTTIELNLNDDTCKKDLSGESFHFTDSVPEVAGKTATKDFQAEERGGKSDILSVSSASKNERLIIKTDFLKSKKRTASRQDLINSNSSETSELLKKKSKYNGEQFQNLCESTKASKTVIEQKELNLDYSSNEDQYNKNAKTGRHSSPPEMPLNVSAAKKTIGYDWVKNLSDTSDEENQEIEFIEPARSEQPSEEQPGWEAESTVLPRPKLTNVVKVPSKKRSGKRLRCETVIPHCATNNSDKYFSKYHSENVLIKNTLRIQERFKHVRDVPKTVKRKQAKKTKAIPSVKNVNIPNFDKSSAMSFEENLTSDDMREVLPESRCRLTNSMPSKSCPPPHTKQKVGSLSSDGFHDRSVKRLASNVCTANEKFNSQEQRTKRSKVHYLNRVGFISGSSERIHLSKLEFGISPIKLGGARQSFKPFKATTAKKSLHVAVSQDVKEKSQMLEFKLCPDLLLGCSSVDEKSTNNMLPDTEKISAEGIRSKKEDWLKIPLKKRKVDMTKFQAESPLLDSPICEPNTSPAEAANPLASGSKATFHAYKQLYLEKRSKSLTIVSGK